MIDKDEVRNDIAFLYNCFRKCVLGDDTVDAIELNEIAITVRKYGFEINEDGYLDDMLE